MKILMLNYEFPPLGGGAGNANYFLLKEFSKDKTLSVDLVTSSVSGFKIEKFSDNITIHYLDVGKGGKNLHFQGIKEVLCYARKSYSYSKKLMRKKRYDLCHAWFGIPSGFVAMKLGLPYIVGLRGSDVPFYNKRFHWLDRFVFQRLSRKVWRKARMVIANSDGLRKLALKTSKEQKIGLIYNGVDTSLFPAKTSYSKKGTLKIVSVGRLIERKGYFDLIKACRYLDVSITIAGGGPLKEELKDIAKEHNVKLELLGEVSHDSLPEIYRSSELFVLPSYNEGMSNTVLEAMASGLALVVTDVGGMRELVDGNGLIVPKGDVKKLREAIEGFMKDRNSLSVEGKRSRRIAEKMSWESVARDYRRVYDETIAC